MCYPLPGPRCSNHARRDLLTAKQGGDADQIRRTQLAYDLTPAGIKDLRAAGRLAEADFAAATRRAQLVEYHASRRPQPDFAHTVQNPLAADPDPTGYSPLEQALLITDLDPVSINQALDALEAREQARLLAYARSH